MDSKLITIFIIILLIIISSAMCAPLFKFSWEFSLHSNNFSISEGAGVQIAVSVFGAIMALLTIIFASFGFFSYKNIENALKEVDTKVKEVNKQLEKLRISTFDGLREHEDFDFKIKNLENKINSKTKNRKG